MKQTLDVDIVNIAVERIRGGEKLTSIANELGIHYGTLLSAVKRSAGPISELKPKISKPSSERHVMIMQLVEKRLSISEIARQVGVTRQAVSIYLKSQGVDAKPEERPEITKAREMVRSQLWCLAEIVREAKVNNRTVYAIAAAEGLTLPKTAGRRADSQQTEAIIIAINEGGSPKDIASRFGIHYNTVYKRASKMGMIKRRNRRPAQ